MQRKIYSDTQKKFKVIGDFLATYYTDLAYIQNFQWYKKNDTRSEGFAANPIAEKPDGMFYKFLVEYGVMRNVNTKDNPHPSNLILDYTVERLNDDNDLLVDELAKELLHEKFTRGLAISLASKILFLNNPSVVFPFDSRAKKALGIENCDTYADFFKEVEIGRKNKDRIYFMNVALKEIKRYVADIELNFPLNDIETIRKNRFIDKVLWVEGR